ncbi:MAG: carboxylating nicotinate-nucleotide diphosphorylase [Flavobacteriaceae bacterium]|nr:carboxylating nicotinate-nucleotide diphosphorylase [Flavobacteriaceae bacterium]
MYTNLWTSDEVLQIIRTALAEDLGDGDHSSLSSIHADKTSAATMLVKADGILAGMELAKAIFQEVDAELLVEILFVDGSAVSNGDKALKVFGSTCSILRSERVVLNFAQHLSGIATATNQLTQKISAYKTKILDTRKTLPGLRLLEKWAATVGGGQNHRFGLYDMILLKDNHIDAAGGIEKAIVLADEYVQAHKPGLIIEVETRNLCEVEEVLRTGKVHRIMLDNFTPENTAIAVKLIAGRFETEASGGITQDTIVDYAKAGVDYISVGAITHSVKAFDLSLKIDK